MLPWISAVVVHSLLSKSPLVESDVNVLRSLSASSSSSSLAAFGVGLFPTTSNKLNKKSYQNSDDDEFPWKFEGRAVLCPMIVQVDDRQLRAKAKAAGVEHGDLPYQPWSLGGWSVGGVVALEYDDSPVGPYIEYVDLGCFAALLHQLEGQDGSRFVLGQVGSRLYVNEPKAMTLCERVWSLEALRATADVVEKHGGTLSTFFPEEQTILDKVLPSIPVTNIPLWWTPTITAIWAQLIPRLPWAKSDPTPLALNRLRISGQAKWVPRRVPDLENSSKGETSNSRCISLGFGVAVNDLLIEISDRVYSENET